MDRPKHRRSAVIWSLGVTQVIGYGTLYYSFSILAPEMARDFDWPLEWVFGAFSVSLLAGGLAAPFFGRWMDRYGAAALMAAGSVLAAAALIFCVLAQGRASFVAALLLIGLVSPLVLYNAAFAALVQMMPGTAQRSITLLTLIGGFASTVFWPLTDLLHGHLSWREVYLAFAGLNLIVCLPVHVWVLRANGSDAGRQDALELSASQDADARQLTPRERRGLFILVAFGFALGGFVLSALLVHMVPLLGMLGLGSLAVLVGSLFGPAQVFSRLINMVFGGGLAAWWLALTAAAFLPVAVIILLLTAPSIAGAFLFAALFGMGSGLTSIVQGTLPLALFGRSGYGELLGRLTAIRLLASSAAPFILALLMHSWGVKPALSVIFIVAVATSCVFLRIVSIARRSAIPR